LSSSDYLIKDTEQYVKFKQRGPFLYGIIGFLLFAILLALTFTFIFIFIINKKTIKNTLNNATITSEISNVLDDLTPFGKK
jgi:hypothetical protein